MSYLLLVTIILVISMEPNIPMLVLVTDTFYFVTGTISLMLVIVTGRAQKIIFRPGHIGRKFHFHTWFGSEFQSRM